MPSYARLTALLFLVLCTTVPADESKSPASPLQVREYAAAGRSFAGAGLAAMDLSGLSCKGLDLTGTKWLRTDLRGARFDATDLTGAVMDEASLRGATFSGSNLTGLQAKKADLSGALFQGSCLAGANLAGAVLDGAQFNGTAYSQTGGRYLDALAIALSALNSGASTGTPLTLTPTLAAGLAGDPFAFVYNTADPTAEPIAPFNDNPLRAAVTSLGGMLQVQYDLPAANAFEALTRAVQAGKVGLVPITLAGGTMQGSDFDQPFWAVATGVDEVAQPVQLVTFVPPFGERKLSAEDFAAVCAGPFGTLEPVGTERSHARYPVFLLSRGAETKTPQDALVAALRRAADILQDQRTYTTYVPGVAGLQNLSQDFGRMGITPEAAATSGLMAWGEAPRKQLVKARREAAAFLDQAAALLPEATRPLLSQAAALFRSEAQFLDTGFPAADASGTPAQRYLAASQALAQCAAIESSAAQLLAEAGGRP